MKENRHYVYIHIRNTNGTVFYVGRGTGNRAWSKYKRNKWWMSVVNKNGFITKICQENLSLESSCLLEMWLIAKFRHEGVVLANLTDGGEGIIGIKRSRLERAKQSRKAGGKSVYCSNGMKFFSSSEAAEWCESVTNRRCHPGPISTCCRGGCRTAYGYSWSYEVVPEEPTGIGADYIKQPVSSSNGMTFDSAHRASEWVRENINKKADSSCILKAAKHDNKTAYGLAWCLGDDPSKAINKNPCISYKVSSSGGEQFNSVKEAGISLVCRGFYKNLRSAEVSIYFSINNTTRTAGGVYWKKVIDTNID